MWSLEQVRALAPDERGAQAAEGLAIPWRWTDLGRHEALVWGRCQGSRAEPYRTMANVAGPLFACDCPSSKRPCKHSIALLLLLAREPERFPSAPVPDDVGNWRPPAAAPPPGPRAPSVRSAERDQRVTLGMVALERWIEDLMRQGLARQTAAWEDTAARMVDAQMPGVARVIRQMGRLAGGERDWTAPVLERLGRLVLLCQAWPRLEALSEAIQADVRSALGFTWSQDELLAQSGVTGCWQVVGQFTIDEERLRIQRTWLYDAIQDRKALILGFSRYEDGHDRGLSLMPGTSVRGELIFYPGSVPLRVLVKSIEGAPGMLTRLDGQSIIQAVQQYQQALCSNPWLELYPLILKDVVPVYSGDRCHVQDETGRLSLDPEFDGCWQLLARSGGHPVSMAGEWNGDVFRPLGGVFDGEYRRF